MLPRKIVSMESFQFDREIPSAFAIRLSILLVQVTKFGLSLFVYGFGHYVVKVAWSHARSASKFSVHSSFANKSQVVICAVLWKY